MKTKLSLFVISFVSSLFIACGEKEQEITVQSIALSQPSAELIIGETLNLKATVSPSNATYDGITWTSTKTSVATVSSSGQVSALAEGNTTITAMAGGKTASCSVTVVKGYVAVSSITLNKEKLELVEGNSETLTATVSPNDATDRTVSWSSSNDAVATVKDGTITAVKEGEATITAKAGEKTASCKVVVAKKVIPVESIELNKTELELKKGETSTLTANVQPTNATNPAVSWSSSNSDIAKVDQSGKVTAISGGEAIITAKAGDISAECRVSVSVPATSVSLNKTSVEMHPSETIQLVATILPEDTTEKASWSSSNQGVASVDETGKVTSFNTGTAIIKIIVGSIDASCSITVSAQASDVISFADDKVKSKLVAAFDTNGDGELSYDEAAAVTSEEDLKAAFGNIKTYKSFDEFQFFTGIKQLAKSMFEGWNLTSITLPSSLTSVKDFAFKGCAKLESIIIPDGVLGIYEGAFQDCSSLRTITISENISTISKNAFNCCSSLTSITIPSSIRTIGYLAFGYCSNLTSLTIIGGEPRIEEKAFTGCNALKTVSLSGSIGREAFAGCTNLIEVSFSDKVTEIKQFAFKDCSSLASIILPERLESIGYGAFQNCTALTSAVLSGSIGDSAFSHCEMLSNVSFSKSVTSIGSGAFSLCRSLTSITIPENVSSIGFSAFWGCSNLVSVAIPESISSIQRLLFCGCSSLESISIPDSVMTIGESAFDSCSSLKNITIPESVMSIELGAFDGCFGLTSITVKPETPPTGGHYMFRNTNDAPVYVPSSSIEAYKSAQYWSDYASRIQAIQE